MAKKKRTRRAVSDQELQLVMQRRSEGVSCAAIAFEFKRSVSVIHHMIKRGKGLVQLQRTQAALMKMNDSPVNSVLRALVDELSKNQEIESVLVNPKTRTCKLVVRRELEVSV